MGHCGSSFKQLLRGKSQAADDRERLGPLFIQEAFSLPGEQKLPGTLAHIHAATAALFNQAFLDELLIPLEHGERVDPIFGRDRAIGGLWVTLLQRALQNKGHHAVAQLAIDRLVVVPIWIH